jgi:hypothetical protein
VAIPPNRKVYAAIIVVMRKTVIAAITAGDNERYAAVKEARSVAD